MTRNFWQAYVQYAVNGVLFDHESPPRGGTFVTRNITMAGARVAAGLSGDLLLGDLDARRDWGYAPEYVEGVWRILPTEEPDDDALAIGTSYSVSGASRAREVLGWTPEVLTPELARLMVDADRAVLGA